MMNRLLALAYFWAIVLPIHRLFRWLAEAVLVFVSMIPPDFKLRFPAAWMFIRPPILAFCDGAQVVFDWRRNIEREARIFL